MRKLIVLLSFGTFGFAGWTVWNDPTIGPSVQAMVPKSIDTGMITASIKNTFGGGGGISTGGGGGGGGGPTGQYGGIGAANIVAGAITGGKK